MVLTVMLSEREGVQFTMLSHLSLSLPLLQDPGFSPGAPSGVLNMTAVAPSNLAVFASKPHFLDADHEYLVNVTGLRPNRSIHDSTIDIEPLTGVCVCVESRVGASSVCDCQ